ncbi:Transcription factor [Nymphaea thermarum]|nr:Transcription factor [Nymphaea thermarum]
MAAETSFFQFEEMNFNAVMHSPWFAAKAAEDGYVTTLELEDMYQRGMQESEELRFLEEHLFNSSSPDFTSHLDPDVFFMDILDLYKCQQSQAEAADALDVAVALSETGEDAFLEEMCQFPGNAAAQCCQPMVFSPCSGAAGKSNSDGGGDGEEEEAESDDQRKSSGFNCKNLVSERNRRKRLSHQLLALRSMVPNITKMDKRSILVDALNYLQGIHEEMESIQKELSEQSRSEIQDPWPGTDLDIMELSGSLSNPAAADYPKLDYSSRPPIEILNIETEMLEDQRYVVKVSCRGGTRAAARAAQAIESLGFEITHSAVERIGEQDVLNTAFIKVKKQVATTEAKLRDCVTSAALKFGFLHHDP